MKYVKFIIEKYRAITEPLEVNLKKNSLIPIIGINECGKTTILQAIFAFDYMNDSLIEGIHLKNYENLYDTSSQDGIISAEIEITWDEFKEKLTELEKEADFKSVAGSYKRKKTKFEENDTITISRNIKDKTYSFNLDSFSDIKFNDKLCKEIVRSLPYILYFDDFRDSVQEKIEIKKDSENKATGWLSIIEQLFRKTDKNYSVFDLATHDDNKRDSIISDVKGVLNEKLTKEWSNFKLDNSDPLQISLRFITEGTAPSQRYFIELKIVESIKDGTSSKSRFFGIRDRSKGFFWFFNFVMKLYFNPKVRSLDDKDTIYLLDEPGSYLHAIAQTKLCNKLSELSKDNKVVYCTHSHYLLDPEIIPINNIKVADKNTSGSITLKSIHDIDDEATPEKRNAFQPIWDALRLKPFNLDIATKKIIIVEGIIDYYAFEMFNKNLKGLDSVCFLPSLNANSITYFISLMIAWQKNYVALWDNDKEGIDEKTKAENIFNEIESKRFFALPKTARQKKKILQNLFEGGDLNLIRTELGIPSNTNFNKTIIALYFSDKKDDILNKLSENTKNNFKEVFDELKRGLE